MARFRLTIAQLMAFVLFAGFGFAAMRSASVLWSSAIFTLTVVVLSAAILVAMARRGRVRMTWVGFALFGWIYFGTTFGPWAHVNGVTPPPYLSRLALDYWDAQLWSNSRIDTGPHGELLFSRFNSAVPWGPSDAFQFRRIGHCLAAIMFGLGGAVLGRHLAAKDERPNS